jgi:CRISPR system Cascade subunit CasD
MTDSTKILVLHFDAPLMSFGAPIVDQNGVIQPYPALSMLTGMVGNALGIDHSEFDRLQRLQERIQYAVREDKRGRKIQDYQTVDLSKPYMDDDRAWTTWSELETRKGGSASSGTHIRERDYWAEAAYTVLLSLDPPGEAPTIDAVSDALQQPERPLFIGRKPCLPAAPMHVACTLADDWEEALMHAPRPRSIETPVSESRAWWPTRPQTVTSEDGVDRKPVTDQRDWANQIHTGERWIAHETIPINSSSLHGNR